MSFRRSSNHCASLIPLRLILLTLFGSFLFLGSPAVRAATFRVTSTADDGSPGTLRAAIAGVQASTDAADTVTITAQGTIMLTGGELLLSNPGSIAGKTVTLTGPGAGALFVSGGHAPNSTQADGSRVFHFSGLTVAVSNLAVIRGFVNSGPQAGAGILQEGGALTLDHCVVEDCIANFASAFGGGIANVGGALTLTHCVITSNNVSYFSGIGGSGIGSQSGSLALTDCTVDFNNGTGLGGGIGSVGETLTLTRCTISDNSALNTTQANANGGGIYTKSDTVTMTDCTLSGNESSSAGDGLYLQYGSATLQGCTFSGNQTGGGLVQPGFVFPGGGLYIGGAVVAVTNCTFTGNSADQGAAIYNQGTLALSNSTVAYNRGGSASSTAGAGLYAASGSSATVSSTILVSDTTFNGESDIASGGGSVTSGGSNLLGDADGNGFINGINHDQTGVSASNAKLGQLADNGGPTPTLALNAGSPAIDADYADAMPTDQRGAMRPAGARNDIGAFESGVTVASSVPDTFTVTNTSDDGDGSLRRAVNNADADPGAHIVFDPSVFGVPRTIALTSGSLVIRQSMTLTGPGQTLLAVSGSHASRVLDVEGGDHALSGLTITGGQATTGGGVFNTGTLSMTDCTITGSTASGQGSSGGGLFLLQGNTTLTRCTITNNTAPDGPGGGINAFLGNLTMTDCTVAGNSATQGGGIFTTSGSSFLTGCTLSGNSATAGGGVNNAGFLFFNNCTLSGNSATTGGGICSSGGLILSNCTVSANTATTGGGLNVESGGTALVSGTILAGNTGSTNVASAGTVTSSGSNLLGDADGNGFTGGMNSDQTGVKDPKLGPLQNNGGPTQTMALLTGSPAINADYTDSATTDQRGAARPLGARSDIGAYEYGAFFAEDDAYTVTENTPLTITAPGVLANDVVDGNSLTAAVQTPPGHGTLNLKADGSFTYTPSTGFLGTDSFTYQDQVAGGPASAPAAVTLTVTPPSTLPTTTASLQGTQGSHGYYRSAVTVTLTASAGAAATFYAVDGGAQQTYTAPFTVSGDAKHSVTFFSKDAAGNAEVVNTLAVLIDTVAPVTVASVAETKNSDGSYTSPVIVTLTATDDLTGIASTTYSVDGGPATAYTQAFTISDAGTHTVTFHSLDNAGNPEAAQSLSLTLIVPILGSSPVLHTFPAGLQLISAPEDFSGVALEAIFSRPNPRLAVWNPASDQYVLSPTAPADTLRPGGGYWVRFSQPTALYDLGTPTSTSQPFSIPLQTGWNMIGDPFAQPVPLSSITVEDVIGTRGTFHQAVTGGVVSGTLYAFPAGASQYEPIKEAGSLTPFAGQWIYAFRTCTLLVPVPQQAQPQTRSQAQK